MTNPEVKIKITGKNNNGEIYSISSMDISEISEFKNKEISPILYGNTGKSFVQGNGLTACFVGELDGTSLNRTGYIFSEDMNKWYFIDFNKNQGDKILTFDAPNRMTFANGYFYLCGNSNSLYRSKDLLFWEFIRTDGTYFFKDIYAGNGEIISLSVSGDVCSVIYSEDNGNTWGLRASFQFSAGDSPDRIVLENGQYYIFNNEGKSNLYFSQDGANFSNLTSYYGTRDIKYGNMESFGYGFVLQLTPTPNISPATYKYYVFNDINGVVEEIPVNKKTTFFDILDTGFVAISLARDSYLIDNFIRFYDVGDMTYSSLNVEPTGIKLIEFASLINGYMFVAGAIDSKGTLGIFKENEGTFIESTIYGLITPNYSNSSIQLMGYGNIKNGSYHNLLLNAVSSGQENESGNYDYYSSIWITGEKIKFIILFFGDDGVFPTKILVNGEEFENSSREFAVDFNYNKNNKVLIEFLELNQPNKKLGIGSISTDVNASFDKDTGLKSVTFEGQKKQLPMYGIISYGGDVQLHDKHEIFKTLSELKLLPNVSINVLVDDDIVKTFSMKNDISIDKNSKKISLVLIDEIETLQNKFPIQSMYFSETNALDVFYKLSSDFGMPITATTDISTFLQDVYIRSLYIEKKSWWDIWNDFCIGTHTILVKSRYGYFEMRGG